MVSDHDDIYSMHNYLLEALELKNAVPEMVLNATTNDLSYYYKGVKVTGQHFAEILAKYRMIHGETYIKRTVITKTNWKELIEDG